MYDIYSWMLSLDNTLLNSKPYTMEQVLLRNLVNKLQSFLKASNNTIHPRERTLKAPLKSNLITEDTNWYLSC